LKRGSLLLILLFSLIGSAQEFVYPQVPDKNSFGFGFENDIWNKTDYCYTNGVSFQTGSMLKLSKVSAFFISKYT